MNATVETRRLYRSISPRWSLYARIRWRLAPFVALERFVPRRGDVLDVGCGVGLFANYLRVTSEERVVAGIDASGDRIAVAMKTVGARTGISFREGRWQDATWKPYDAVTMVDFVHHLDPMEQDALLERCVDNLAPGGRIVLMDIAERPRWKHATAALVDRALNGEWSNFRSIDEWRSRLEALGCNVAVHPLDAALPLSATAFIATR